MLQADEISSLTSQVRYNCAICDSLHAGLFSVCGLAMRLRDLYKWEQGLPPWEERESAEVLEWIEAKENKWENYPENGFEELAIDGRTFDPFDTVGINTSLNPHNIFYGAGYARSLKPTFFLADIAEKTNLGGNSQTLPQKG